MEKKFWRRLLREIMLALGIFSIMMNLAGCGRGKMEATEPASMPSVLLEYAVEYQGKYYLPREDLQTILIMGLDKNEHERPDNSIAYTNGMQSDFLMLLILDEKAKVCDVLHLNRDTMTEIPGLGVGGGDTGTFIGQLALAHTYGSGGSDSCINAKKAVSNLLGGVTIDHYVTLTMDAVVALNDLVGGVTLTLMEDFTEFDPAMKKGAELTLKGDQALTYVRFRMTIGDGGNTGRMKRQEQYLSAFYTRLMEKNRESEDFLLLALRSVNDSFTSDLSVNQLDQLGKILSACTLNPFRSLEGKTVRREESYEFYADQDALQKTVTDLFYTDWQRD